MKFWRFMSWYHTQSVNQFLSDRVKLVFLHHPLIMGYNSRKFGMTLSGRNYITCRSVLAAASLGEAARWIDIVYCCQCLHYYCSFMYSRINKLKKWLFYIYLLTTITKPLYQPSEKGMSLLFTCPQLTEESSLLAAAITHLHTLCNTLLPDRVNTTVPWVVVHFQCTLMEH